MNILLGWFILICLIVFVGLGIFKIIQDDSDWIELWWSGIIIVPILIFLWLFSVWFGYIVALPNEYQATIEAIEETKSLIQSGKELNLEDVEIHKRLSELIQEKYDLEAVYRKALRNPFVLFKPKPLK